MRISVSRLVACIALNHQPRNRAIERDDLLNNIAFFFARDGNEIGPASGSDAAEAAFSTERACCPHRYHRQGFFRRDGWESSLKLPHLREQAQIGIARETIGAQANVEPELAQSLKLKSRMAKIFVTAGAMNDVKFSCRYGEQIEITFDQLIYVRDDPRQIGAIDPASPARTRLRAVR